jgi:Ca-activated chloride channel family protein
MMLPAWLNITFNTPWLLSLLLLLPLIWVLQKRWPRPATMLSSEIILPKVNSIRLIIWKYSFVLRYLAVICMIIALARPQLPLREENIDAESIEIALIVDLSSSMLAQDFQPNRLEASKIVATQFIQKRMYDLFCLVVFAAESYTPVPLTSDHKLLINSLQGLQCGDLEDGTAIGMGLANGVARLKAGKAKSKIVILLTDGVNNAGYIQPATAAALAKDLGIRVYSIGVGSMGEALSPVTRRADGEYIFGYTRVEIDEPLLTKISEDTGGKYYRATDQESLERIYAEIDQLEKTKIQTTTIKLFKELYRYFLLAGLFFILLEVLIHRIWLKILP